MFAALDELRRRIENAAVQRIEEMMRFEERRDTVERLVIDQNGPQQGLFGLDVVRGQAEGKGLFIVDGLEVLRRGGLMSHDRETSRFRQGGIP